MWEQIAPFISTAEGKVAPWSLLKYLSPSTLNLCSPVLDFPTLEQTLWPFTLSMPFMILYLKGHPSASYAPGKQKLS